MPDQFSNPYKTTGKIIVVYFNLYVLDIKWQDKVFVYFSLLRVQIADENIVVMMRLVASTSQLQPALISWYM